MKLKKIRNRKIKMEGWKHKTKDIKNERAKNRTKPNKCRKNERNK